jgi:hypothetical protein
MRYIFMFIFIYWLMCKSRPACSVLWSNLRDRNHLEDLGIDGRIILKYILRKHDGGAE